MTNAIITLTTTNSRTGNADGFTTTGLTQTGNNAYSTSANAVAVVNQSRQLAGYYRRVWVRIYGGGSQAAPIQLGVDPVTIILAGDESADPPFFQTLTLTKDPVSGG